MANLKLKLKKIDPVKYGLISGTILALIIFSLMLVVFLFSSLLGLGMFDDSPYAIGAIMGGGIGALIFAPIIYFIFGFFFGFISTLILNFVLKKTGGLTLEFDNDTFDIETNKETQLLK